MVSWSSELKQSTLWRSLRVAICCIGFQSASCIGAETIPSDRHNSVSSESSVLELRAVIQKLPQWISGVGTTSFHLDIAIDGISIADGDQRSGVIRHICDHRPGLDVLLCDRNSAQSFLCVDDTVFEFLKGKWCRKNLTWTCQLKEMGSIVGSDRLSLPDGPIVVDLPHLLQEWRGEHVGETRQSRVTNSYIAINENKSWLEIRLRSPNDTELLGCELSEVLIVPQRTTRGMPEGRISIRSFATNEGLGVRLKLDRERMESVVLPDLSHDQEAQILQKTPHTALFAAVPQTLKDQLLGRPLKIAMNNFAELFTDQTQTEETRRLKIPDLTRDVISEIRGIEEKSLSVFINNRHALSVDDPAIRWRRNERVGWQSMPDLSFIFPALLLSFAAEVDQELIYSGFDAVADLGSPVNTMERLLTRESLSRHMLGQELFIETIFRSRYMYHVEPEEIDATVAALVYSQAGSEKERVAVETLLRLDEYDRVPTERFQRWWDAEIVKADKVFRWDTLCMLSFHPGNRAMLLERLPNAGVKLSHEIWKNLKLRAESTVRTNRWDFMSEAECQTVLALPEPPVPGKDTEGGAAKPFPKDD